MCDGTWIIGGVHRDGQYMFCTTSCFYWTVYFLVVFYVLVFMIITSSWIDGVIGHCYPDTFYLFLVPHLLKQPFFYNILAFILNISTKNKHKQLIDFMKMLLFDVVHTIVVFAFLWMKLERIARNEEQCIITNNVHHRSNPNYFDPISIQFVLYSIVIIHAVFLCLACLRFVEGIIFFDRKKHRRHQIMRRLHELRSVYQERNVHDGDAKFDADIQIEEGNDLLYIPPSFKERSFSKSYASIWDISGKFIRSNMNIKTTLLGSHNQKDACRDTDDELMCVICMDEFQKNQTIVKLECQHIYHDSCALEWFDQNPSCPICRQQVFKLRV